MIKFLAKNIKQLFNIGVVLALSFAFFFFDPLSLFGIKSKLNSTANIISNIREIGELTTAEYFGEVITSWKEAEVAKFSDTDYLNQLVKQQYIDLKHSLWNVYINSTEFSKENDTKVRKRNIDNLLFSFNPTFSRSILYDDLLQYINRKFLLEKKQSPEFKVLNSFYNKKLKPVFESGKVMEINNFLFEYKEEEFQELIVDLKKNKLKELNEKRKTRNKNMVFLGRGWVKAGFNFSKIKERNFLYDKDNAAITFIGILPEILDADINPWFIPEKEIKGFELLSYESGMNFNDAIKVKIECKNKLRAHAIGSNILKSAAENGEAALKNFFTLVIGKEIRSVSFFSDKFEYLLNEINKDNLVSIEECLSIEKSYRDELAAISSEKKRAFKVKKIANLLNFIEAIKGIPYLDSTKSYSLNYFSFLSSRLLANPSNFVFLNKQSIDSLLKLRKTLGLVIDNVPTLVRNDSLWFQADTSYMRDFNSLINVLEDRVDSIENRSLRILKDMKYDFPYFNSYVMTKDSVLCGNLITGVDSTLKAIKVMECALVEKEVARRVRLMVKEEHKYLGIPSYLKSAQARLKKHFSSEKY